VEALARFLNASVSKCPTPTENPRRTSEWVICAEGSLRRIHKPSNAAGSGLSGIGVGRGDGVYDTLRLLVPDLLVVIDDISQVISTAVVSFSHRHGIVCQIDITVVAEELRHDCGWDVVVWVRVEVRQMDVQVENSWSFFVTC
jgi:hypothetical protein